MAASSNMWTKTESTDTFCKSAFSKRKEKKEEHGWLGTEEMICSFIPVTARPTLQLATSKYDSTNVKISTLHFEMII